MDSFLFSILQQNFKVYSHNMFKNPFSFEGRIRRSEYGISYLIYFVYLLVMNNIVTESDSITMYILLAINLLLIWFVIAQTAKRCHDKSDSGWFQLIPLYIFWLLVVDGDPGENIYGPNPKGGDK